MANTIVKTKLVTLSTIAAVPATGACSVRAMADQPASHEVEKFEENRDTDATPFKSIIF